MEGDELRDRDKNDTFRSLGAMELSISVKLTPKT